MKNLIKKILKEEFMDDMDWLKGDINPWLTYDAVILDVETTKEEINKYIEMALSSRNIKNESGWSIGRKDDLQDLYDYQREGGGILSIIDDVLSYGTLWFYKRTHPKFINKSSIKYSQLVNNINESEENDLEWIINSNPRDLKIKKGDRIKVHNIGDKNAFIKWLGYYGQMYVRGDFGPFFTGLVDYGDDSNFIIMTKDLRTNLLEDVSFPQYTKIDTLTSNDNRYIGLNLYYEII